MIFETSSISLFTFLSSNIFWVIFTALNVCNSILIIYFLYSFEIEVCQVVISDDQLPASFHRCSFFYYPGSSSLILGSVTYPSCTCMLLSSNSSVAVGSTLVQRSINPVLVSSSKRLIENSIAFSLF